MRDDIDALAGHFFNQHSFHGYFVGQLVPWGLLAGEPNAGHAAVADFLLTGAAHASLTANFDTLVEQWCNRRKVAFRAALNAVDAAKYAAEAAPLLKFHGCMTLDRENTLWTQPQLNEPAVQERIASCREWMEHHLPGKDLLLVGFWTEWGYLNQVLAELLSNQHPGTVTVMDYSATAALKAKAPDLWEILSSFPAFTHVEASSDEALSELRAAFAGVWVRKLMRKGAAIYEDAVADCPAGYLECPIGDVDALYDLRRDAEGIAYTDAAREREPSDDAARVAYARMLLTDAGAEAEGAWFRLNGRSIRVVNGRGRPISKVKGTYNEPPSAGSADVVICAGGFNGGTPSNIVLGNAGSKSITGPTSGGTAQWITLEEAQQSLQ